MNFEINFELNILRHPDASPITKRRRGSQIRLTILRFFCRPWQPAPRNIGSHLHGRRLFRNIGSHLNGRLWLTLRR